MIGLVAAFLLAAGEPPLAAPNICVCTDASKAADIEFRGVVTDALLTADATGKKINSRQAAVFQVIRKIKGAAATPMKVYHTVDPTKCGVQFNYSQTYVVRARLKKDIAETDSCLMPELKIVAPAE
jgi:hypothetical protein